ncbi:MAG: phosphatase PAP2 family protein [Candidatus Bathyarchaeia archaeon]
MKGADKPNYWFVPSAIFTAVLLGYYLTHRIFPGPEALFLCLFVYVSYIGSGSRFLKTFSPFIISFLSYEALNRLIVAVPRYIYVLEPVAVELWIFKAIPTLVLQQQYRMPILDCVGAIFYSVHLIAPTFFAFLLWRFKPEHYQNYTLAFIVCTYSALLTFLVFPVAPPWYGVRADRVLFQVDRYLKVPVFQTIYDYIGVNPFAAFPSLHSAYPWLIAFFSLKTWKKKALPALVFPITIWFSAVYLGEHYVIDVIGGIAYATLASILACNRKKPFKNAWTLNNNKTDSSTLCCRRCFPANFPALQETVNFPSVKNDHDENEKLVPCEC